MKSIPSYVSSTLAATTTRFALTSGKFSRLTFLLIIVLFSCWGTSLHAQTAEVTIVAAASCDDADGTQALEGQYYIVVTEVNSEDVGPFEVSIDDLSAQSSADLPLTFGPFDHSGSGGSTQLVSVTSLNSGITAAMDVPEVLCGVRPDGGQASGAFCRPTTDPDAFSGAILVQSAPGSFMAGGSSGQIQQYVLVDDAGFIVQVNMTGLFENLPSDTFQVFAVNYRDGDMDVLDEYLNEGQSFAPVLSAFAGEDTETELDNACFTICDTDPVIMVPVNCLSIGSTVFTDNDDDALYEPADGEEGIAGVTLNLYAVSSSGAADSLVATTMTDDNGDYFFGGLDEGQYVVSIPTAPDGYPLSSTDAVLPSDATGENMDSGIQPMVGDSINSPIITLEAQTEPENDVETGSGGMQDDDVATATSTSDDDANGDMTVDFGFVPTVSLGSTVFIDVNDNAVQDPADPMEAGIPGVTVNLYGLSSSGMIDSLYASTETDGMGNYLFDMLLPGSYVVGVEPSDEFPVSSTGGSSDPEDGTDGDDNGVFSDLMMTGLTPTDTGVEVYSGVVLLMPGMEPTFAEGETAQGAEQDGVDGSPEDANGNMTVDFGFVPGVSIGSTVFFDLDNDGLYEPSDGESGIAGVEVFLYAADGETVLDSIETDSEGNYFFGGLAEGTYQVGIPESSFAPDQPLYGAPNSSTPTTYEGDNQSDDNDNGMQPGGSGTAVLSGPVELTVGGEPTADGDNGFAPELGEGSEQDNLMDANGDMTIDFGFFPTMSIGSQVFYDADNSGDSNDGTDPGVDDVVVLLFADVDGNDIYTPGEDTLVDMTITMDGGLYEFDTLAPGDYIVAVIPPDTASLSSNGPAEDLLDNQSDGNDNGSQVMDGDTIFSMAINLSVGEEPEAEDGEVDPGADQDADDDQDDDGDMTVDFGILPSVSVGSTVFEDTDNDGVQDIGMEAGVPGIIVTLLDDEGNEVATDTTDADGNYFFDGLTPGDYELTLTPPDSLPISSDDPVTQGDGMTDSDDDGMQDMPGGVISSGIFTLEPNAYGDLTEDGPGGDQDDGPNEDDGNMTYDFGLVPAYSLGSTVFEDTNNNAVQDGDETGVSGVPVTLYSDVDMDGFTEGVDTIVAMTTTDGMGNYFFDGLLPGTYVVGIQPTEELPFSSDEDLDEDDPDTDIDSDDNGTQEAGAGSPIYSGTVTLDTDGLREPAGDEEPGQGGMQDDASMLMDSTGNMTVDFGLFPGVSVGSTVFADEDGDGIQDDDEDGIAEVDVILFSDVDGDGFTPGVDTIVAETTTDENGDYLFDMLPEGNYVVAVVPDEDFPVSSDDPGTAGDEMTDGDDDGMQVMSGDTTYSATVVLDAGAEPTLADGEDGQASEQDGDNTPEDANGNMTIDFGFTPGVSIGSTVFYDLDNDGLFEESDGETGIVGVEVFLYAADGTTVLESTVTDDNGNYFFGGLDEGTYIVGIPESSFAAGEPLEGAPNSSTPTFGEADDEVDNNDNGIQAGGAGTLVQSSPIELLLNDEPTTADGENGEGSDQDEPNDNDGDMTVDFGFFPTMSIGSQVFYDADNSGDNNDGTDPGVDDVEVLLFADVDGNNSYTPGIDTLVDMTITMNGGLYEFDTLAPGDYIVAVIPPDTASLSSNGPAENTADDQSDDNDNGIQAMDGDTIFSTAINLTVGEEPETIDGETGPGSDQDADDDQDDDGDMTVDFGILPSVSVGSTVFQDDDNSGVQEDDEEGVPGIVVTLLDGEGNEVATDTTDADGNYFFTGLYPGDYQLAISPPDSLPTSSTDPPTSGDGMTDSDDDGMQDSPGDQIITEVFTLTPNAYGDLVEDGEGGDQDDGPNEDDGNMTFDFGLVPNYSLGSTVFADLDNDAVQDDDEEGISDVPVTLYSDVDMDGYTPGVDTVVATTVTDSEGNYFFENLLPGKYTVGIVPTEDLPLSSDEDLDEDDPNADIDGNDNGLQPMSGDSIFSGTVTLGLDDVDEPLGNEEPFDGGDQDDDSELEDASGNMTVDFGLFPGVSVGSTVFLDNDNDGFNDPEEPGISGVEVVLFQEDGTPVDTTYTDDNGNYFFGGLPEGAYYITLTEEQLMPGGLFQVVSQSSTPDNDADDDIDNNDDGSQAGGPGTVITSEVFELFAMEEPVNGPNPATDEFNGGATQDDDFDSYGNMTVDFGIFAPMFDLAIIKTLCADQERNVEAGDTVCFSIRVLNQGNIAADNIRVSDYLPSQTDGFLFDASLNPGWNEYAVIDDTTYIDTLLTTFNGLDSLAMDSFVDVPVYLVVNPAMEAVKPLTNVAEISAATGPNGLEVTDVDSPMDTIPGNDEFFEDNEIDGNGLTGGDEDNSDPETIFVGGFDLALQKGLADGESNVVAPNEDVTFTITVENQGAIPADSIALIDYIPDGFVFYDTLNPQWTYDGTNATDTLTVADGDLPAGGLLPGQDKTVTITLTVAPPMFPDYELDIVGFDFVDPDGVESGETLINTAEITFATDDEGEMQIDIDSTPDDMNDDNDDGTEVDDEVNGGGDTDGDGDNDEDEDDSDIAVVTVTCYQDAGGSNRITVCLGCDEAEVVVNLFESLRGRPNVGGTFVEGEFIFVDDDGADVEVTDINGVVLGEPGFNPEAVVIPGILDRSLDYTIDYIIPAVNDCPERRATITIDIFDIQNLTCDDLLNVSLGEDCEAEITPDLLIAGDLTCVSSLETVILTLSGDTLRDADGLPTNIVGNDQIGQTLNVSVIDPQCENSCWGSIIVEDKKRPVIECPADTASVGEKDLICTDLDEIFQDQLIVFSYPDTLDEDLAFLRATGIPQAMDNCTPDDDLVFQLSDFLIPVDDNQCAVRTIRRTFTVTDGSGNSTSCVQFINVRPPTLDDVVIPTTEVVEISCGTDYETLPNGNPVPSLGGEASIMTAFGMFDIPGGGAYCNIAASYEDGPRAVTCPNTFKFIRTFRIIDWCNPEADPIIYTQLIKVGDFAAPVFTAQTQDNDFNGIPDQEEEAGAPLVFPTNTGTSCTAIFRLDDNGIGLTDDCSDNITLTAVIYPNGDLTAAPIGTFSVDLNDTEADLTSEIPVGQHILRYTYTDDCGNTDFTDIDILIEDRTAPVASCEDGLNVSITNGSEDGQISEGVAILTPDMIDKGSYDDCSGVTLAIARVDENNLAEEDYGDEITLTCADIGTVRVGLRVRDALGNENFCWLDVLVEDKLTPVCIPPSDITLTCIEYNASLPADITESTVEERNAVFGVATGLDNCSAALTETIVGSVNNCGVGSFTRTFTVNDGLTSTVTCRQTIEVIGVHDYQITFPTDISEQACADVPTYMGISTDEGSCDLISVTTDIDTLETLAAGDECYKLRITYDIINWCEYNSLGQPYLIPRDGAGPRAETGGEGSNPDVAIRNPETQELYLNIIPRETEDTDDDFAFLSTDGGDRIFNGDDNEVVLDDGDDMDGSDDDNGNDNIDGDVYAADDSRGHFRYVQFVKVYDRVAPTIVSEDREECFGGAGENCEATVTLAFTATDDCATPVVSLELDANYVVADGFTPVDAAALGIGISVESDTLGNFVVVATNVPVGQHALRVNANDGCGNADVEIIEFCVVGDKAPTPICIRTVTVTLMPDGNGGGMGQIWASDYIASDVEDCFGNTIEEYSIYTESDAAENGFVPVAGDLGLDLTCDDLGDVPARVYAIADNGSADYCSVIIAIQANDESVCGDNGNPNLAGVIITESMDAVENVSVDLEGAEDLTRSMVTGDNGAFSFTDLPAGQDYTVTPTHFQDYLNGVRTSDIVAITRHILGVNLLDSPYKHIAADVDGNTEIDVADIINIRRLILGLSETYPNGMPSWSFVPADYEFAELNNPWAESFPSVSNFNNLTTGVIDADFIGTKLGDVNGSAVANSLVATAPRSLRGELLLELDEQEMVRGERYRLPVTAAGLTEVDGYQFTLEFDRAAVTVEAIEPGLVEEGNFGWRFADRGLITTSWNWTGVEAPTDWTGDEVLFTLVVRAEANGRLSEALEAGSRYTEAEAYERDGNGLRNLSLAFNEDVVRVAGYRLLPNLPNPVRKETTIGFEMPEAHGQVTVSITDAAGRLVREYKQEGFVGYNSVIVSKRELGGASGVYSYTVTAGEWVATKRMVLIE